MEEFYVQYRLNNKCSTKRRNRCRDEEDAIKKAKRIHNRKIKEGHKNTIVTIWRIEETMIMGYDEVRDL
jgi:hypothetical protein